MRLECNTVVLVVSSGILSLKNINTFCLGLNGIINSSSYVSFLLSGSSSADFQARVLRSTYKCHGLKRQSFSISLIYDPAL